MILNKPGTASAICAVFISLFVHSANAQETKSLDELMSDWLSLESQKGKLQTDWDQRKEQLTQRLALYSEEEKALEDVIAKNSASKSDVDQKRKALVDTQTQLESEQKALRDKMNSAIQAAQATLVRLPPPLKLQWQEKMDALTQSDGNDSEKLDDLLSLFKMLDDFNARVAINRVPMKIPDDNGADARVMVTQIFLGVSQGWYVSEDGKYFGYGKALPLGWRWWNGADAEKELGQSIDATTLLKVLSILKNPTTATYLSLPVKL